ncbi:hypothetical protein AB0I68_24070, partial [Streptomyces sp. NPDC050448]
MTAWQYFAGAGLVAVLCPLQGHVAVADDGAGRGHGARLDARGPPGRPPPPAPTAHHRFGGMQAFRSAAC